MSKTASSENMQKIISTLLFLAVGLISGKKVPLIVPETTEDKLMQEGLKIRPYTIVTEDGYKLALIHVVKKAASEEEEEKGIPDSVGSVLLHHGTSMDGFSWFET